MGVHAEDEVGKVITGGVVDVPGRTMFDKMRYLAQHEDGLRKLLLFEPRGAPTHCANLVLPSSHPKAKLGYVIMESTEYAPMSGSNTTCTVTAIRRVFRSERAPARPRGAPRARGYPARATPRGLGGGPCPPPKD